MARSPQVSRYPDLEFEYAVYHLDRPAESVDHQERDQATQSFQQGLQRKDVVSIASGLAENHLNPHSRG